MERPIFKPYPRATDSIPLTRDKNLVVSIDKDIIRSDFLEQALNREGVDPSKALYLADNLEISFDIKEYLDHISEFNPLLKGLKRTSKQLNRAYIKTFGLISENHHLGAAFVRDPAKPSVHFNLDVIAKGLSIQDKPEELRQALFISKLEQVWRHEREHLVRSIHPESVKVDSRNERAYIATSLTTWAALITAWMVYTKQVERGEVRENMIIPVSLMALQLILPRFLAKELFYFKNNKAEKKADMEAREGKNRDGIFYYSLESK